MPNMKLPLLLVTSETLTTVFSQRVGAEIKVPTRVIEQSDAEFLYSLLRSVDVASGKYELHDRTVRRLKKAALKLHQLAEAKPNGFDGEVGVLDVSEEDVAFLGDLIASPPENFKILDHFTDSKVDLKDAIQALKEKSKK